MVEISTFQIYAYIGIENLRQLEQLKEKNQEKGYSKIVDAILTKHFSTIDEDKVKVDRLYKIIETFESKCNNYEYEIEQLKKKKGGKKKKQEVKE